MANSINPPKDLSLQQLIDRFTAMESPVEACAAELHIPAIHHREGPSMVTTIAASTGKWLISAIPAGSD